MQIGHHVWEEDKSVNIYIIIFVQLYTKRLCSSLLNILRELFSYNCFMDKELVYNKIIKKKNVPLPVLQVMKLVVPFLKVSN